MYLYYIKIQKMFINLVGNYQPYTQHHLVDLHQMLIANLLTGLELWWILKAEIGINKTISDRSFGKGLEQWCANFFVLRPLQ